MASMRKVLVYGRSYTLFQLINRPPISSAYQLIFTPNLNEVVPSRVKSDIVLVGGAIPDGEKAEILKRFDGSKIAVALLHEGALRDWGRDKVAEGIFGLLNESLKQKEKATAEQTQR
jgi:hypothetical protein